MSFDSEYKALRKRREELEKRQNAANKSKSKSSTSVSNKPYAQKLINSQNNNNSLTATPRVLTAVTAPVKSTITAPLVKPKATTPSFHGTVLTVPITADSMKKKSLFDTRLFDDGWDFGDISRTIIDAPLHTFGEKSKEKDVKEQQASTFDQKMNQKYSSMSLSDIEKELARVEEEEKKFKEENGGKFANYLAKAGSYLGAGKAGQSLDSMRAKSEANIDKINDYTREKEIINIYRKQRATEEHLGGLNKKQLQMLDDIGLAEDLNNAKAFALLSQPDNMDMAGLTYDQQTAPKVERARTSRKSLLEFLRKQNSKMNDEELNELLDNMVELRKNQVNAETQEKTETELKKLSTEHPVGAFILSRGANFIGGPVGLTELHNQRDNEYGIDTNAPGFAVTKASNTIDEQIQLDHDWEIEVGDSTVDGFDLFYKVGTGVVDNVARMAVSGGNTTVAGAMMFTQATTQSIIVGKEKGYSDAKALALGLLDGTFEAISEKISLDIIFKDSGSVLKTLAKSFAAEGGEELTSNWLNRIADAIANGNHSELSKLYESYINQGYTEAQAMSMVVGSVVGEDFESFLIGGLSGAFMGGGNAIVNSASNTIQQIKANKLTDIEQKVFDKVVEDRIAEATEDGKKPTKAEEKKIREAVLSELEKGYITTDTIESMLGGETYETYKNTVDNEKALQDEFDALNKMKTGEMTGEQTDRRTELKQQLQEFKNNSNTSSLKEQLSSEVMSLVKGSRLSESYNEKTRRRQAFTADLSKYDAKQQETVKRAVESGILNDTNRTHDFVDMIAKISADKGVSFDFINNQKLKESGFALEGKTVNGYVTGDGNVAINIDSVKSLNTVVGHEITHILEGTELYNELQQTIVEYAKAKGEYQSRYDAIAKLYEGIEGANIDNELAADLVGDYLFTDSDFISRLSTENRNLFQKMYDEVKYLCKVATAGSKEARQLEKVKRTFEKVYRESKAEKNTAEGGVRYSLNIQYSDGTVEELADARNLTDEQALNYLNQARKGELRGHTYIPVRKDTPLVIIDALKQVGEEVDNLSLVMQARKAQQAMSTKDKSSRSQKAGNNIRAHALTPKQILEIVNGLDDPSLIVYQTERYDKNGKQLPNNVAVFVEYNNGEREGMAVVEFDSDIDSEYIGIEHGDTNYHTVVTVFEPDTIRNGTEYDYAQELLENPNNIELEIKRRPLKESATREKHPNTFNELSSDNSISNSSENVKQNGNLSLSAENTAPKEYGNYNVYGDDVRYQPDDIAPVREDLQVAKPKAVTDDIAPVREDITPKRKAIREKMDYITESEETNTNVEADEAAKNVAERPTKRSELHHSIVENIKTKFTEKGFDFDKVLKNAKNLSTISTVDNTPQRVMEKALGNKQGQILADETVNKVAQNESEGIKWLNSFTDRKNGVLAQISNKYKIKPGSKESAAAQMYAEGFYMNEKNEYVKYGDRELAQDFPDSKVRANIKGLAEDPQIRQIYDETLAAINEARSRNLYPEIPRLDNYFLHFRAMEDTFSRLGLPFNPNDIRAKDLPTDLNGVTADLKPGQPYFASAMKRRGVRTTHDLLGGLERYLTSAKNQIYHIDDIQKLRAIRNYIADTYGQAKGLGNLDSLSEEEAQERIEQVYGSHLSTFAKFLNEEANVLAGKTSLIDRGLEGIIGRRGISLLNTINGQVGSNMVGFNISSSLTNFLPVVQTFAKTNKGDFIKALAQTASDKLNSLKGKSDGFKENSPVVIRRKGADRFHRTPYQKIGDAGYVLMSAVDDISTEIIARTKYNELTRKGMDSQQAHFETDKWVSRLMGDRSLGQMPQLYNSKMLGLITKFQLEVRNQLDSQFYDTIQEAKVSNEDIQNKLLRNAKTAAKVTSTFFQLAVAQHLFGKAFEAVAGYNPAFDIIDILLKTFGFDDDEEDEDTPLDNLEEGFFALLEDLPYTSTFSGGRIPISSAMPVEELIKGVDEYGNEKSRMETIGDIAPYYLLPAGYGQIKKTAKGLKMFDDDFPVAGSYTDSGSLRFPVEETPENILQAFLFGQYANKNAQTYFDEGYAPLKEKQIEEYKELDVPIADYWKYREGLSGLKTLNEKGDYIGGLDLSVEKKNLLINNIAGRETPIDMTDYHKYSDFEEFDFATRYPEKYKVLQEQGISVKEYKEKYEETAFMYTDDFSWAANNPEKYEFSKVITDDVIKYREITSGLYEIRADKDANGKTINGSAKAKKKEYIWGLDIDDGAKYILFKNEYNSVDDYNYEIIDYLNNRDDISYDEMKTILVQLGFEVDSKGNISW